MLTATRITEKLVNKYKLNNLRAMDEYVLTQLIAMAEDGYKLSERNAAHQEFLKEDREILRKAREYLKEIREGNQLSDTESDLHSANIVGRSEQLKPEFPEDRITKNQDG